MNKEYCCFQRPALLDSCINDTVPVHAPYKAQLLPLLYTCKESLFGPPKKYDHCDEITPRQFGLGPDTLVHRLLLLCLRQHDCARDLLNLFVSPDLVVRLSKHICDVCGATLDFSALRMEVLLEEDSWDIFKELCQYIRSFCTFNVMCSPC
jgi:hypothetical protein